jgi:hypothetical protein
MRVRHWRCPPVTTRRMVEPSAWRYGIAPRRWRARAPRHTIGARLSRSRCTHWRIGLRGRRRRLRSSADIVAEVATLARQGAGNGYHGLDTGRHTAGRIPCCSHDLEVALETAISSEGNRDVSLQRPTLRREGECPRRFWIKRPIGSRVTTRADARGATPCRTSMITAHCQIAARDDLLTARCGSIAAVGTFDLTSGPLKTRRLAGVGRHWAPMARQRATRKARHSGRTGPAYCINSAWNRL